MVIIDANVIMDVLSDSPEWRDRSQVALQKLPAGSGIVGPIVYAELAFGYPDQRELDRTIQDMGLVFSPIGETGAHLAGRAYAAYRARGGTRVAILADFFVGAQAAELSCPLLTRDPRRYRTAFPDITIVEP